MRNRARLTGIVMVRSSPAIKAQSPRRRPKKMGTATARSNKVELAPDAVLFASGDVRFATDVIATGRSGRRF